MPSPFPGMDPYLEGDDWTSFHAHFAIEIARQLTSKLRPKYIAMPQKRFVIVNGHIPHTWVEIRDTIDRRPRTTIEILSPWTKRGPARSVYLANRRKLLLSAAHLIEIDLLRDGFRLPMSEPLPPTSYCVIESRADQRPMSKVWPIALEDALPYIPVPLLAGDADAVLDLQAAFQNVYDLCGFDIALDYTKPPSVPLLDDQAAWVAERLRAARR
jgi:hypothetical protein